MRFIWVLLLLAAPAFASSDAKLRFRVPKEKNSPCCKLENMTRDWMIYCFSYFTIPGSQAVQVVADSAAADHDWAEISEDKVFPEALAALKAIQTEPEYIKVYAGLVRILKTGLYDTLQEKRHASQVLPNFREDLIKLWGYRDWPKKIIPKSAVKELTRVLYWNPSGEISIAETLETQKGDLSAPVRETEIILKRENSNDWDFYVFDKEGRRAVRSEFTTRAGKTKVAPAPQACLACHYDSKTRTFQNLPLSYRFH